MQNIGFFVLLLGVLVTVHELGHFLLAKACGVKVLKFSIGFGPKLVGFTKGETEYVIALLPLGGYVKMAGDVPGEELPPEEASRGFLAQPPWKRMLIVLAGPAFNLVFPVLIYFFVYLGPHEALSTRLGNVIPGSPAAAAGLRPGDRILAVEGEKVRTFGEMREAFEGRFERPIPLTVERDGKQFTTEVKPVKYVDSSPFETVERGMIMVEPTSPVPVVGVPAGSPAEQAGLKTFDRILSINGTPVPDEAALYKALAKVDGTLQVKVQRPQPVDVGVMTVRVPEVVELQVPKQPDKEGLAALGAESKDLYVAVVAPGSAAEQAGLRPGDRLISLNGEELGTYHTVEVKLSGMGTEPFELVWRSQDGKEHKERLAQAPLKQTDEAGNELESLRFGIRPWLLTQGELAADERVTVTLAWDEALRQSVRIVPRIIGGTVVAIGKLLTRDAPLSSVGGPIMMYQMAAKYSEQGWDAFLTLMAAISVNLGVMNLLPIPILDGFHLVAAGWESVRRRPIPIRVREIANVIGLAMLVALMLIAMFNDITKRF